MDFLGVCGNCFFWDVARLFHKPSGAVLVGLYYLGNLRGGRCYEESWCSHCCGEHDAGLNDVFALAQFYRQLALRTVV